MLHKVLVLRAMRNRVGLDNTLADAASEALDSRLPDGWSVSLRIETESKSPDGDALIEIRSTAGTVGTLLLEAKNRLNAHQAADLAPRLLEAAERAQAGGALIVASYLSRIAQDRIREVGVSYLDMTGNTWIVLDRPALFIENQGAEKDPDPPSKGVRSLKGAKAARIVRALCDWRPPMGVRELARRAGTDPGYTSRVARFLGEEDLLRRELDGSVGDVDWQGLIKRWSQDYVVTTTNRSVSCLAPRGLEVFTDTLRRYPHRYALTGSLAVPGSVLVASTRLAYCYIDNAQRALEDLDLRLTESGANVLLLEPFDSVVYERTRIERGITKAALSQCSVDLLTGSGREPVQAEALLTWMASNEGFWRT